MFLACPFALASAQNADAMIGWNADCKKDKVYD
jgi:hypothetical protein